jgi:hypothetical protein
MKRALILTLALVLAVILGVFLWPVHATTSTLTGTFKDSSGNPITGTMTLQLPLPAVDTATNTAIAPTVLTYRVINGVLQSGPPVFDVAGLQPQNLYYQMALYDTSGVKVMGGNYPITGTPYNISAAVPTTVTTNNVSYISPAATNTSNTFCCTQTFSGQIVSTVATGTAPLSITSTTLVPNLNIDNLNGVVVTGTPVTGNVPIATSSTTAAWGTSAANGFKLECINTTPVTVANTTALSPLQGCTIPAGDIGANQTFLVEAFGAIGETGVGTALTFNLYLDTVAVTTTPTAGLCCSTTANGQSWTSETLLTGLTTGVSGTLSGGLIRWWSSPSMGGVATYGSGACCPVTTINTTVSHTLQIQVQWGAANALNTITGSTMTVYRIG